MLIVGLTGGISSGKSTVLEIFRRLGSKTIDADRISHQLARPGTQVLGEIARKFGKEVLNRNGRLNRKRLAGVIFGDRRKRRLLNKIMHPRIIAEIESKIERFQEMEKRARLRGDYRKRNILVIDIPLLFEAKLEYLVDKIVLVYVPRQVQIERLRRDSNFTFREAKARLDAQIPLYRKRKYADYIIDGNLHLDGLKKQVESVWKELQTVRK